MTPTTVTKKPIAVTAAKHRSTLSMNATPAKKISPAFSWFTAIPTAASHVRREENWDLLPPEQDDLQRVAVTLKGTPAPKALMPPYRGPIA